MAKILIIDDDPDIVESMRVVLTSRGHQVVFALKGANALDRVRQEKPHLLILDVMLPDADGFDISRQVKNDPELRQIPILMLTAIKERTGFDFSSESGDNTWLPVDNYCEKPLKHEVLLEKIENLLKKT